MSSLSSTEKETDSPWVPSRRVVSKVKIFMRLLKGGLTRPPQATSCRTPGDAGFLSSF